MDFISVWNGGTSTEMSYIFSILSVDVDLCVIQGVELLSSDQGVACYRGFFVPPSQEGAVLLEYVVHGRSELLICTLHSIGDIGAKDIPVQRNEQLSWIVGIVISRPGLTSGPECQGIDRHNHILEGEGADEPMGGVVFIGTLGLDNKIELLIFKLSIDRIDN